jgi:TonB family protein
MVRRAIWTYILIVFVSVVSVAQDKTLGGPDSIVAGPYGVPRLVADEGGGWDIPIQVFEDDKYMVFIPDLTAPSWVQWHLTEFRTKGIYFTYIYLYGKETRSIERDLIYVNAAARRALIENESKGFVKVDLSKGPPMLTKSIERITSIVRDEFAMYNGPTLEGAIKQEERIVAGMAAQIDNPDAPTYVPEGSHDAKQTGITPPVAIKCPLAQYTAEAKRLKINGAVLIAATIDTEGHPQNVRVIRSLGYGMDEQAVAAVKLYEFTPAIDNKTGEPVQFEIKIEVNFRVN